MLLLQLLPKVDNPRNMTQLHLISLCNVLHKTIVNILINRLKCVISKEVSENQSVFISRCFISNNILVAYELLHTLTTKR